MGTRSELTRKGIRGNTKHALDYLCDSSGALAGRPARAHRRWAHPSPARRRCHRADLQPAQRPPHGGLTGGDMPAITEEMNATQTGQMPGADGDNGGVMGTISSTMNDYS